MGALAVGLLATVDPFEQLKKGTDTSRRNTTTEIYNAMIRYYSTKSSFPWSTDLIGMQMDDPAFIDNGANSFLSQVIEAGELKRDFIQLAGTSNLGKIFITSTEDVNSVRQNVAVCFLPESKSFANEGNAKYTQDGELTANGCKGTDPTGSLTCYWCIK